MHFLLNTFLIILSLFSSKNDNDKESIHYVFDKNETYTAETITSATSFVPLKEDINNGLATGVYWFKISPKIVSTKKIVLKNSHILKAEVYIKDSLLLPLEKESFIAFTIPKVLSPVFLKVYIEREAYIPIRILTENYFLSQKFKINFLNGIYYGFIVMLFTLNLFYFFHFKEISFYLYLMALLFVNISLAFSDGTFNYIFSNASWLKDLELINHYFLALSGYFFASNFLELNFYIPKIKPISIILLIILLPFVICYSVFNNFIFYVISEILVFIILGMYLTCGFILYKKSSFAKFFCLAYSIIFIFGLEYFIARDFGINVTDFKPVYLKIGGLLEMFLISYAIVYRMNVLKKENELMVEAIFKHLQKINHLKQENVKDIIEVKENEFSEQELEIIQAINSGLTNQEIANKMYISISTVKYHTKKIYTKLQIESRKEIQKKTIQLF